MIDLDLRPDACARQDATLELLSSFQLDALPRRLVAQAVDLSFRFADCLVDRANRVDQTLPRALSEIETADLLRDLETIARD